MAYNTKQKNEIISHFTNNPDKSFTADQVFASLEGIGKSSVYRIIAALADEGILKREQDGRKCAYRLPAYSGCHEHLHLKCRECGRLLHLDEEISHALEDKLKSSVGFSLDESTLLYGKCESCKLTKH